MRVGRPTAAAASFWTVAAAAAAEAAALTAAAYTAAGVDPRLSDPTLPASALEPRERLWRAPCAEEAAGVFCTCGGCGRAAAVAPTGTVGPSDDGDEAPWAHERPAAAAFRGANARVLGQAIGLAHSSPSPRARAVAAAMASAAAGSPKYAAARQARPTGEAHCCFGAGRPADGASARSEPLAPRRRTGDAGAEEDDEEEAVTVVADATDGHPAQTTFGLAAARAG
jgi:hypothetical protein